MRPTAPHPKGARRAVDGRAEQRVIVDEEDQRRHERSPGTHPPDHAVDQSTTIRSASRGSKPLPRSRTKPERVVFHLDVGLDPRSAAWRAALVAACRTRRRRPGRFVERCVPEEHDFDGHLLIVVDGGEVAVEGAREWRRRPVTRKAIREADAPAGDVGEHGPFHGLGGRAADVRQQPDWSPPRGKREGCPYVPSLRSLSGPSGRCSVLADTNTVTGRGALDVDASARNGDFPLTTSEDFSWPPAGLNRPPAGTFSWRWTAAGVVALESCAGPVQAVMTAATAMTRPRRRRTTTAKAIEHRGPDCQCLLALAQVHGFVLPCPNWRLRSTTVDPRPRPCALV